jgi:hypothetical protein
VDKSVDNHVTEFPMPRGQRLAAKLAVFSPLKKVLIFQRLK